MFEGFATSRIDVAGCCIHVRHGGAGPPLLLLHGYPQTHVEWHKVAPQLAERFTVVCPDLRGYGDSDKPPSADDDLSPYCKRTTAHEQLALMRELGFSSFHVVGHDRGVRVALRMALDHPDAVRSLVNLDVMPSLEAFEAMDASLSYSWFHWHLMRQPAPFPETMIGAAPGRYLDFIFASWTNVAGAITPEAYAEYLRCFSDAESIRATCADYRAVALDLHHDQADRGTLLRCPVLVLWGAEMPRRPGWQTGRSLEMLNVWRERAAEVSGGPLPCGHFIPEELPDELLRELFAFLPAG